MELAQWQQTASAAMTRTSARIGVMLRQISDAEKTVVVLLARIGEAELRMDKLAADQKAEKKASKEDRKNMKARLRALENPSSS